MEDYNKGGFNLKEDLGQDHLKKRGNNDESISNFSLINS